MKDITSTSFGLIIAYLLPGAFGFYTLSFYSAEVEQLFLQLTRQNVNFSLLLIAILFSLFLGLTITPVRWIVYERILCRKHTLKRKNFVNLTKNDNILVAFKSTAEEYYRYHQFWGSSSIVLPFFGYGLIISDWGGIKALIALGILEIILIAAAVKSLKNYITSANRILEG